MSDRELLDLLARAVVNLTQMCVDERDGVRKAKERLTARAIDWADELEEALNRRDCDSRNGPIG